MSAQTHDNGQSQFYGGLEETQNSSASTKQGNKDRTFRQLVKLSGDQLSEVNLTHPPMEEEKHAVKSLNRKGNNPRNVSSTNRKKSRKFFEKITANTK